MDLSEALGLDGGLPEQGKESHREIHKRLEAGESVREVLEDRGHDEETIRRAEHLYHQILNADPRELAAIRANLVLNVSYASWLERWLRSGDPAADWGLVMLPDFDEEERIAALRRILDRMKGRPLHPKRWRANRESLMAASEDLGVPIEDLAEARGWEAVARALDGLTPQETRNAPDEVMARFRSALQRLVCDDLLPEHDWEKGERRSRPLDEAPDDALQEEADTAARARSRLEELVAAADLTQYKKNVLDLAFHGYSNAEIAEELDRSHSAIRRARSDAYEKLREVEGPGQ